MSIDLAFVDSFERIIDEASQNLLTIGDAAAAAYPGPGKWSRKEIVGHLIDSAVHNQTRFVRAQLQDDLIFPGYDQDAWVRTQNYNERPWRELIETWRTYNRNVAAIMRTTPAAVAQRPRTRHNLGDIAFQPPPPGAATLEFLMRDYVGHLQHHLRQILRDWI